MFRTYVAAFVLAFLVWYSTGHLEANSAGRLGNGRTGCGSGCHIRNTAVRGKFSLPTEVLETGKRYDLVLTATNAAREAAGFSADLKTVGGKFDTAGAEGNGIMISKTPIYATHSSPRTMVDSVATWIVPYIARPTAGNDTIYLSVNTVNGNGTSSGDQWNIGETLIIRVAAANAVTNGASAAPQLRQLGTTILFDGDAGDIAEITVSDLNGRKILQRAIAAGDRVDLSTTNLPAGTYLAHGSSKNGALNSLKLRLLK
jgi:hypothetical protein